MTQSIEPLSRVSSDLVIESYRKTGLKPIRGAFMNTARDGCCPMGVLAMTRLKSAGITLDRYNIGLNARRKLGFAAPYFEGFVCGWDGEHGMPGEEADANFVRGLSDGRTVYFSLLDAGLIEEGL